ncbi:hypothetical protein [Nocardia salmonicida]|uniref:hypothetical protein n=1 Tax=Nocardia salmonicida TaxID=53431 RepID=UPI00378C59BD
MHVVAPSVADVVEHAGGWLFDRSMAGWEVTVLLARMGDPRPLHILGARAGEFAPFLDPVDRGRLPHSLAVAVEMCHTEPRAHAGLAQALAATALEVRTWGDPGRELPDIRLAPAPVVHRLSLAARTFKSHALIAAGRPDDDAPIETFHSPAAATPPSCTSPS